MNHIEVTVECADERQREILLAELADFPFESFCEEENCLKAYIREADYRRAVARIDGYLEETGYRHRSETIEDRNWNELWESNFEPIDIEGKCASARRSIRKTRPPNTIWSSCRKWLSVPATMQRPT